MSIITDVQKSVNSFSVLVKGVFLFLFLEFALFSLAPNPGLINVYAPLGLEHQRLPISTTLGPLDKILMVGNLDAMLASHIVSRPKVPDEFRVMVFGDSEVWGLNLPPNLTLPGQLNAMGLTCGYKKFITYNVSYPRPSATKDIMILDKVLPYQPDMIIWLVTLYTLIPTTRSEEWLVNQNPAEYYKLARQFGFLPRSFTPPTLMDEFYIRQRDLSRVAQFQIYSLIQLATNQEQIPGPLEVLPAGLTDETTFEKQKPPTYPRSRLSLDQVEDFHKLAGKTPVLLINEPILILNGIPNSDIRYNSYYPRWAYDQYRQYLSEAAVQNGWDYLDLWNILQSSYFTDAPLHLSPVGERKLAEALVPSIQKVCPK